MASLAVLASSAGVLTVSCHRLPAQAGADFGDTAAPPPEAGSSLAYARYLLGGPGAADAGATVAPAPGRGRRIILSLWHSGEASVATANASTLAAAVEAAARSLGSAGPAAIGDRLELDVPTALDGADLDDDIEIAQHLVGLEGFLVTRDDGKTGVVLPSEIVQRAMFQERKLDHAAIATLLAARAGVDPRDLATMRAYRFRANTHVESLDHHVARPVIRAMAELDAPASPALLLAAARRGADYLVRVLSGAGRYVYLYHPIEGRDDPSYGWLRHAGTTYALLEAYEEFGNPIYLEKAEAALRALAARLSADPKSGGKYLTDTNDEEQQKVGGAGLALLAMSKHAALTGQRDGSFGLDPMRAIARFIMRQQYEDGHFRANADVEGETGKRLKREAIYYPGEAVLGLLRLYGVDPQPAYLEAARKGADYIVHFRDAFTSEDNQEHDHWMSYAFNELYRLTRNDEYLEHAYKIARAILKKQRRGPDVPAPDYAGTFYDGQTTPASTRIEAYDADIVLSRFAGKPDGWLLDPATEAARSVLGQQFEPGNDYWLKNPGKADGGVRESPFVSDIRIDYVQHAMSAWIHLARILRDPAYGKTGAPSQDPVRSEATPEPPRPELVHAPD